MDISLAEVVELPAFDDVLWIRVGALALIIALLLVVKQRSSMLGTIRLG